MSLVDMDKSFTVKNVGNYLRATESVLMAIDTRICVIFVSLLISLSSKLKHTS